MERVRDTQRRRVFVCKTDENFDNDTIIFSFIWCYVELQADMIFMKQVRPNNLSILKIWRSSEGQDSFGEQECGIYVRPFIYINVMYFHL